MNSTPPDDWLDRLLPHLVLLLMVIFLTLGFCLSGRGAESDQASGRWMQVMASAYCPCQLCCGERAAGLTATGADVGAVPYGIAAHPGYLPYGTRIVIPAGQGYLDQSRTDRAFTVDDTGGVIRRLTVSSPDVWIDLRFRSHASAIRWGVRPLRIFVLDHSN